MPSVTLEVDMGKYKNVTLPVDVAEKLIIEVSRRLNVSSKDVMEAIRIIMNFDEFYDFQEKKFKDYVVPDKDISDMIKGAVVVDSLKLIKRGGVREVTVIFDRRVSEDVIAEALRELGYEVNVVRHSISELLSSKP